MEMDWDVFGRGIQNTGQLLQQLLLQEYQRKKDYADWQKKTDYEMGIYGQKQGEILERQAKLDQLKRRQEGFETTFGKNPYVRDLYERATSPNPDPHDQAAWGLLEGLKQQLASGQALDDRHRVLLRELPPAIQSEILAQDWTNQEALRKRAAEIEDQDLQRRSTTSEIASREDTSARGKESLALTRQRTGAYVKSVDQQADRAAKAERDRKTKAREAAKNKYGTKKADLEKQIFQVEQEMNKISAVTRAKSVKEMAPYLATFRSLKERKAKLEAELDAATNERLSGKVEALEPETVEPPDLPEDEMSDEELINEALRRRPDLTRAQVLELLKMHRGG